MDLGSVEGAAPIDTEKLDKITTRIDEFKSRFSEEHSDTDIVQEFILHGSAYALEDSSAFAIKKKIADRWDVNPSAIFIVGSAKTGFSIAPPKRYKPFGDDSDVDVAIVDHQLYQRFWHELHIHKESGAAWHRISDFERFAAWGWIRPDMLPPSSSYHLSNDWWEFFLSMKRDRIAGPLKIAAAVYHDISFLERYQERSVFACRQTIEMSI